MRKEAMSERVTSAFPLESHSPGETSKKPQTPLNGARISVLAICAEMSSRAASAIASSALAFSKSTSVALPCSCNF